MNNPALTLQKPPDDWRQKTPFTACAGKLLAVNEASSIPASGNHSEVRYV